MNWMQIVTGIKFASPEGWLRSQGIPDEILAYALDDDTFPRKMQKWVAIQLGKLHKLQLQDGFIQPAVPNPEHGTPQETINRNKRNLIEIRDMFNHRTRAGNFDINQLSMVPDPESGVSSATEQVDIWQAEMDETRGEGHANLYTQPNYNAEDLGDGFRMVEVVPDDLANEGAIMQHCVGDDDQDYFEKVTGGNIKIYSLRDAKGWPHATIEIENDSEFDIEEHDNDPETSLYDAYGNPIETDWNAYNQRHASWNIVQIQGKQTAPPVDKYRPFLKTWLETHRDEFNVSDDDLLSATPEKELIALIIENPNDVDTFKKIHKTLSPEGKASIANTIIANKGIGWSTEAIEEMLSKLTDIYPYEGTDDMSLEESKSKRKSTLVGFLNTNYADVIRSMAMHNLSIDLIRDAKRDPPTKEWLKNIVANEESSPGVADAALKLLVTQIEVPSQKSPNNPDLSTYYDTYDDDILPLALSVSERFDKHPASPNLHVHILKAALQSNLDNQTTAMLIERAMIKSMVSTYEIRADLNEVDSQKFYEVWQLLSDRTRNKLMTDDAKTHDSGTVIFENMNKHQFALEEWKKYQDEWDRYNNNVQHSPRLQPPDVQIPEWQQHWARGTPENDQHIEDYQARRDQLPMMSASQNWLQRIAQIPLNEEVFIDDYGTVYGADGDIGPDNHDTTVLNIVLGSLDEFDELESLDPSVLDEDQWRRIDAEYPGFIEYVVGGGGLPKEYAVLHMGWIRVQGSNFEMGQVTESNLQHAADYAHESTNGNMAVTLTISDRATNKMIDITLGELDEALQQGQGTSKIYMLSRRPQGLY